MYVFRLTVQKDNPNKGRQFYTCPKPQHECCNFFKWANDVSPDGDGRFNGSTWGPAPRGQSAGKDLLSYAKSWFIIKKLMFVLPHILYGENTIV
jgi:hypothetical protein